MMWPFNLMQAKKGITLYRYHRNLYYLLSELLQGKLKKGGRDMSPVAMLNSHGLR